MKVFVNLPVESVDKSTDFFRRLGFEFDQRFTDENATCMVLSDEGYVMLLTRDFFATFAKKPVADVGAGTGVIVAVSVESRDAVDELFAKALEAGAESANDPTDQGFMYLRSFHDLDGHQWELFWMDESAVPQ